MARAEPALLHLGHSERVRLGGLFVTTDGIDLSLHQQHFIRLGQYNAWFNGQLIEACGRLDDAERRRDRGAFFGSIHDTLDHLLLGDRSWLGRIERSDLPFPSLEGADLVYDLRDLRQGVADDWDAYCAARRATDAVLEAFVWELTPELLASDLSYRNSKDLPFTNPLWQIVGHVFNHGTHHRGQATTLLMQAGIDPGMTDFLVTTVLPFPERV